MSSNAAQTNYKSPKYRIIRTDLSKPLTPPDEWEELVPEKDDVLEWAAPAKGYARQTAPRPRCVFPLGGRLARKPRELPSAEFSPPLTDARASSTRPAPGTRSCSAT